MNSVWPSSNSLVTHLPSSSSTSTSSSSTSSTSSSSTSTSSSSSLSPSFPHYTHHNNTTPLPPSVSSLAIPVCVGTRILDVEREHTMSCTELPETVQRSGRYHTDSTEIPRFRKLFIDLNRGVSKDWRVLLYRHTPSFYSNHFIPILLFPSAPFPSCFSPSIDIHFSPPYLRICMNESHIFIFWTTAIESNYRVLHHTVWQYTITANVYTLIPVLNSLVFSLLPHFMIQQDQ